MIKAITTSAQTVGQPIPEKTLINSTDTALAGFTKNIAAINTQSKDYGKLLSDTIRSTKQHKWKTNTLRRGNAGCTQLAAAVCGGTRCETKG